MNLLTYFEHLLLILLKFNCITASLKKILIFYFFSRLKPSARIQIDVCYFKSPRLQKTENMTRNQELKNPAITTEILQD